MGEFLRASGLLAWPPGRTLLPLQPPHTPTQPAHHHPIASAAIPSLSAPLLVGCLVLWCCLVYLLPPLPPATMGHLSHGNRQRKVPRNNRLVTSLSWLNLSSPLASSSKPTQWAETVSAFSCSWPCPVLSCFRAGCEIPRNSPLMWNGTQHFHGATQGPLGSYLPSRSWVHLCGSPSNWRPVRVLSPPAWSLLFGTTRHSPTCPTALTPVLPSTTFPQT